MSQASYIVGGISAVFLALAIGGWWSIARDRKHPSLSPQALETHLSRVNIAAKSTVIALGLSLVAVVLAVGGLIV